MNTERDLARRDQLQIMWLYFVKTKMIKKPLRNFKQPVVHILCRHKCSLYNNPMLYLFLNGQAMLPRWDRAAGGQFWTWSHHVIWFCLVNVVHGWFVFPRPPSFLANYALAFFSPNAFTILFMLFYCRMCRLHDLVNGPVCGLGQSTNVCVPLLLSPSLCSCLFSFPLLSCSILVWILPEPIGALNCCYFAELCLIPVQW